MRKKTLARLKGVAPYDEWERETLRNDRELAVELLRLSMESLSVPEERGGALLALRSVAEAYGGLGAVAKQAGVSREALYRALSPKGNPTLKTLLAVLGAVGVRLSVTTSEAAVPPGDTPLPDDALTV